MPNFRQTGAPRILKIQWFPWSILIFVQKSCFFRTHHLKNSSTELILMHIVNTGLEILCIISKKMYCAININSSLLSSFAGYTCIRTKKTGFFPLVKESLRAASNLRSWCNGSLWGRTRLGCKYSSASRRPAHISAKHQKTRQKLRLKNSSNWRTILLHITVWRFLNMKHTQWPETEIMWLYCCLGKFVKWFQVNHIFAHNSLTIFEYLACIMTGNGNHVTLLLFGKTREMTSV